MYDSFFYEKEYCLVQHLFWIRQADYFYHNLITDNYIKYCRIIEKSLFNHLQVKSIYVGLVVGVFCYHCTNTWWRVFHKEYSIHSVVSKMFAGKVLMVLLISTFYTISQTYCYSLHQLWYHLGSWLKPELITYYRFQFAVQPLEWNWP